MRFLFIFFSFFICEVIFSQEEKDTSELKGLRFANAEISVFTTDFSRGIFRVGPEAKFDFTYEHKANFYLSFRNAAWFDDAFSRYSNKQSIFNLAYSTAQKKYLNMEVGVAWNVNKKKDGEKKGYTGIRGGLIYTQMLLPLYYDGSGKSFSAPYSIKQGLNSALSDTMWSQNMSAFPSFNSSANVYGVSTTVRSADVFIGIQKRYGYDPNDDWFNAGDARCSEFYFDLIYNLSTNADNLLFANTKFTPQFVKLNKFGARIGWNKNTHLLLGFYYGVEAGLRPGYNFYDATKISASGKANASSFNYVSVVIKLGFKLGAPTATVKRNL